MIPQLGAQALRHRRDDMDWFFTERVDEYHLMTGEDAQHITKALRKSVGELLTLCDNNKIEHLCMIERITPEGVLVHEISAEECLHEPSISVTLYASLTKGDKMESVIQKSVELGVHAVVPVLTSRCISRPDAKAAEKKRVRYQKIAELAAMQSRRAIIPIVSETVDLKTAVLSLSSFETAVVFYEGGGVPLRTAVAESCRSLAIFTGPEGGFEESEIALLTQNGALTATLGSRILRAETAPLAALSAIMFHTHNLE